MSSIEICGCYHDKDIWSPCDNHSESIFKNATLTGGTWWQDTTSGGGPEGSGWPDDFLNNFTGPRRVLGNTNPLIEHGINSSEFNFLSTNDLHRALHATQHSHSKIKYKFTPEEQSHLEDLKAHLLDNTFPAQQAGEAAGLVVAQAQARVVPNWSASLHLALAHNMSATGWNVDGHKHSKPVPPDLMSEHLKSGHNDDSPNVDDKVQHSIYHLPGYAHFVHNKLSNLIVPDHGHPNMPIMDTNKTYDFPTMV